MWGMKNFALEKFWAWKILFVKNFALEKFEPWKILDFLHCVTNLLQDREIGLGESVEIGSLLKLTIKLANNTLGETFWEIKTTDTWNHCSVKVLCFSFLLGIYGFSLQSLEAATGEVDELRESLVRDG